MRNEPVHEESYKDLTIKIYHDDDPRMNPVENWDMLGKQVYWHRRYILGHEQPKCSPEEWFRNEVSDYNEIEHTKEFKKLMKENPEYGIYEYVDEMNLSTLWGWFETKNLIVPVQAYEHGGITISANGRRAGWDSFDSGQLGFVYVSHKNILSAFGGKRITKKLLERAEKSLIAEVEEYDNYLTGKVYGYVVEDEVGEELESCWGFIGNYNGYVLEEAKSQADYWRNEIDKEAKLLDKRMVE